MRRMPIMVRGAESEESPAHDIDDHARIVYIGSCGIYTTGLRAQPEGDSFGVIDKAQGALHSESLTLQRQPVLLIAALIRE